MSVQDLLNTVAAARNDLARLDGAMPAWVVLGRLPRLPPGAEDVLDRENMVGLTESSVARDRLVARELAHARYKAFEAKEKIARAFAGRARPQRGPYEVGEKVLVFRSTNPLLPHRGRWRGPGVVLSREGSSVVYVQMGGRLYKCAPEQLRHMTTDETTTLQEVDGLVHFLDPEDRRQLLQTVRGFDLRPEAPSGLDLDGSAEPVVLPPPAPEPTVLPPPAPAPEPAAAPTADPAQAPAPHADAEGPPPPRKRGRPPGPRNQPRPDPPVPPRDRSRSPRPVALTAEAERLIFHKPALVVELGVDLAFVAEALHMQLTDTPPREVVERIFAAVSSSASARKARVEVSERHLLPEEQLLFREAKSQEWKSWISNRVVQLVDGSNINAKRVIRSRWVLSYKKTDDGGKKPKARLVLLGYQDPDLGSYRADAPTCARSSKYLFVATAVQLQWKLFTLDAHTAFLSGDASERAQPLYFRPPQDLAAALAMEPWEALLLQKAAYGLSEAPRAWWRRLHRVLTQCGFVSMGQDPCLMALRDKSTERLLGAVAIHVDDLLCGGSGPAFDSAMKLLEKALPFGDRKSGTFNYTGVTYVQSADFSVEVHQDIYSRELTDLTYKLKPGTQLLDEQSVSAFKAKIGELNWLTTQTRLDGAFDSSYYAGCSAAPTKTDALGLNRTVRRIRTTQLHLRFVRLGSGTLEELRVCVPQDAGWASRQSGHSQAGALFLLAEASVLEGLPGSAVCIDWLSAKIARVVRSSYACETHTMLEATDYLEKLLSLVHQFWFGWDERRFRAEGPSQPSALVTDCKGLYTHLSAEVAKPAAGEKRLVIDQAILRQSLTVTRCKVWWVNNNHMPADALTKLSEAGSRLDLLRNLLRSCTYRISYCAVAGRKEKAAVLISAENLDAYYVGDFGSSDQESSDAHAELYAMDSADSDAST